jgi:hypothetical protein
MPTKTSTKNTYTSIETQVLTSVNSMFDFTKNQVENTLVEANNRDLIDLDEKNLQAVINLVSSTITAGFVKSSGEISSLLKSLDT